jgi:hypothetical protein
MHWRAELEPSGFAEAICRKIPMIQCEYFGGAENIGGDHQAGIRQIHGKVLELSHKIPTLGKMLLIEREKLHASPFKESPEVVLGFPGKSQQIKALSKNRPCGYQLLVKLLDRFQT